MKIDSDILFKLDLPDSAITDEIVGKRRWTITHKITFAYEGKYYQALYSEGATEMQDEGPWEYEPEVECTEVQQVERVVKVWEPIKNE
jgi:hypothetical protein